MATLPDMLDDLDSAFQWIQTNLAGYPSRGSGGEA